MSDLVTINIATCCIGTASGISSATVIIMPATSATVKSVESSTSFFLSPGRMDSMARTARSLSCRANFPIGFVLIRSCSAATAIGSAPTKDCIADDLTTNCSTSELAVFDIFHWKTRIAKALPAGRGTVTKTGDVYEIIIMWDEKRTGVTGEGCSGNGAVDLKCYTLHAGV